MSDHAVVIAGGGPTGLMLAAELALAGVGNIAIVERRPSQDVAGSRSGGLHARTIEIFDQRGIADRFLKEGQIAQVAGFAGVRLDISDFPTRHPYGLGLWQMHIERILAGWVGELGVPIRYGLEVTGFTEDDSGVTVALSDGSTLRAQYLVGCDGGRSLVRKAAGIDFPGTEPTISSLIAQVEMTETPPLGIHRSAFGIHSFGRMDYKIVDGQIVYADSGPVGVMVAERTVGSTTEPTLADLREALIAATGKDYGIHSPISISRFTDAARQAATYRKGRVLVAGDAAHIHSPEGGQGLQTGIGDAVNLGWKLAQVVKGLSPEALLDTYHAERHPVGTRVLRHTMAPAALRREDARTKAALDTMVELLGLAEARQHMAAEMSGLGIRYDLSSPATEGEGNRAQHGGGGGDGHPLLGRRMPDLDLVTADGPLRLFNLLHQASPLFLNLGDLGGESSLATRGRGLAGEGDHAQHGGGGNANIALAITPWADRVLRIDATTTGRSSPAHAVEGDHARLQPRTRSGDGGVGSAKASWELPALGPVLAPAAVLIRPDGYVAWVGDGTDRGLADALTKWFGSPSKP